MAAVATTLLAGCASAPRQADPLAAMPLPAVAMERLPGWSTDHVAEALAAFVRGCQRLALTPPDQQLGGSGPVAAIAGQAADWLAVCTAARAVTPGDETAARIFCAGAVCRLSAHRPGPPGWPCSPAITSPKSPVHARRTMSTLSR